MARPAGDLGVLAFLVACPSAPLRLSSAACLLCLTAESRGCRVAGCSSIVGVLWKEFEWSVIGTRLGSGLRAVAVRPTRKVR